MRVGVSEVWKGLVRDEDVSCVNAHPATHVHTFVTGFGKIGLNAANNFFQYHRVKLYGSIFFEKIFMAEMDRHQLALAYDAVVSSGVL